MIVVGWAAMVVGVSLLAVLTAAIVVTVREERKFRHAWQRANEAALERIQRSSP